MDTPICDYLKEYSNSNSVRLHMPGHKGICIDEPSYSCDITEIDGADNLWDAQDIIKKSTINASILFGCHTFYSTGGSTLCIQGMLTCLKKWSVINNKNSLILAGRNAHKSFINAAALLGMDISWIMPLVNEGYESCTITASYLDSYFSNCSVGDFPVAVYVTSPDYLGNILDINALAYICHKYNVFLIVDNAHGAYLKFLDRSMHPIDLGADMCCDSAHKTLPVLTGGAYLHISNNMDSYFADNIMTSMSIWGSSSPSYLIMASLDKCNRYLDKCVRAAIEHSDYELSICSIANKVMMLKDFLNSKGFTLIGDEPLKITIKLMSEDLLMKFVGGMVSNKIVPEYYDRDKVVLMFSAFNSAEHIERLVDYINDFANNNEIIKICPINDTYKVDVMDRQKLPNVILSPQEVMYSDTEYVAKEQAVGRVLATPLVSTPPCVPLFVYGEQIDERILEYDYDRICVVKSNNELIKE